MEKIDQPEDGFTPDDLGELQQEIHELTAETDDLIGIAAGANQQERVDRENMNRPDLPPGEVVLGEEQVRLEVAEEQLQKAQKILDSCQNAGNNADSVESFESAKELVSRANSTLDEVRGRVTPYRQDDENRNY